MRLKQPITKFVWSRDGNVATTFAVAVVPLTLIVSGAISYSQQNAQAVKVQDAIDAAALAGVTAFQSGADSAVQAASAKSITVAYLNGRKGVIGDLVDKSTVTVDAATKTVRVDYSSTSSNQVSSFLPSFPISRKTTATLQAGTSDLTPVCILITNPSDGHTLLTADTAKLDIYDCMVQVNTDDWDAVQADNTSYIHITSTLPGARNCYVGSIHFGDVLPPKEPTCTLLADPYAGLTMPAAASAACADSANYTHTSGSAVFNGASYGGQIQIKSGSVTFDPSGNGGVMTFCKSLQILGGSVTFQPGTYYFNGASFTVQGSGASTTTITALQTAFVLSGSRPSFSMQGGTLTMSAATAGPFKGFQFYWPLSGTRTAKMSIKDASMKTSGVLYLAGAALELDDTGYTHVGSVVADKLLPSGSSVVSMTGDNSRANPVPSGGALAKSLGASVSVPKIIR